MAIQQWVKLRNGESVSLERALAAFDMFVLHERQGDFVEVCMRNSRVISRQTAKKARCLPF